MTTRSVVALLIASTVAVACSDASDSGGGSLPPLVTGKDGGTAKDAPQSSRADVGSSSGTVDGSAAPDGGGASDDASDEPTTDASASTPDAPSTGGGDAGTGANADARSDAGPPPVSSDAGALPTDDQPLTCLETRELSGTNIGGALAALKAGSCLVVPDGDYAGFSVTQKGTAEAPIVIRAKNRLGAKITSGTLALKGAAHVVIEGFTITTSGGVRIDGGCQHCRLTRNKFSMTSAGSEGAWIYIENKETTNTRIDRNAFGPFKTSTNHNFIKMGYASMPQQTRIDRNHFFDNGPRVMNGKEALRIGWSRISMEKGFTTIERNLFTDCDGDPEIVSVKSGNAIVRYNTVRNSSGVLSLRHGNDSEMYGNFIFGDGQEMMQGGIRIYGENHVVHSNYIENTTGTANSAAIALDSGSHYEAETTDESKLSGHHRSKNVKVVNNTLVNNNTGIQVGWNRHTHPVLNCTIANNVIVNSKLAAIETKPLKDRPAGTKNMVEGLISANNVYFGGPAPTLGAEGARELDPQLAQSGGWHRVQAGSPVIGAGQAQTGVDVKTDVEGQPRSALSIGADELSPAAPTNRPLTEADVGPNAP